MINFRAYVVWHLFSACGVAVLNLMSASVLAGSLAEAKRMHDRLTGVPPSETVLLAMEGDIEAGRPLDAAYRAMENDNFYRVTLKNWVAPWTNREYDVFVPLNDYIATVMGLIRDGERRDFRTLLYEDIIYVADPAAGLTPYASDSNLHYEQLEASDLAYQDVLVARSQSSVTGIPQAATAGVVTSRAASKAFFIAGTNRANFRFTLLNHLCRDLEQVHDVTLSPDRIRQDISRSPGGDARVFLNNCVGCHNGMDPLAQAFAYYDYDYSADVDPSGEAGRLVYNPVESIDPVTESRVVAKYWNNASTFPEGFVTKNDAWENYWRAGINQNLGWDQGLPGKGQGARSMLQELAHSEAFAQCQVKKVFQTLCLREPESSEDRQGFRQIVETFKASAFNMKRVFGEVASFCRGDAT